MDPPRRRGDVGADAGDGGVGIAFVERVLVDPLVTGRAGVGIGEGEHRLVGVEVEACLLHLVGQVPLPEAVGARRGHGEHVVEEDRPLHVRLARHQVLHRLRGLDPRPAAAGPAGAGVEGDLEAEPLRFPDRVREEGAPLVAHELHRAAGDPADVYLHQDHAAEPRLLHRREVRGDPLAGEVPVHHEPVRPRPRGVGRLAELRFEGVEIEGKVGGEVAGEVAGKVGREAPAEERGHAAEEQMRQSHGGEEPPGRANPAGAGGAWSRPILAPRENVADRPVVETGARQLPRGANPRPPRRISGIREPFRHPRSRTGGIRKSRGSRSSSTARHRLPNACSR